MGIVGKYTLSYLFHSAPSAAKTSQAFPDRIFIDSQNLPDPIGRFGIALVMLTDHT